MTESMFSILNVKSWPTHSLISPPHLTTVVLTPPYSCWAGGGKLVKGHPPASWNTPNHSSWRRTASPPRLLETFPDWLHCVLTDWLTNQQACLRKRKFYLHINKKETVTISVGEWKEEKILYFLLVLGKLIDIWRSGRTLKNTNLTEHLGRAPSHNFHEVKKQRLKPRL